jgi:hypothetical protein
MLSLSGQRRLHLDATLLWPRWNDLESGPAAGCAGPDEAAFHSDVSPATDGNDDPILICLDS